MDIPQDPPSLPKMADLRSVAADLDDIDEVLARLDAADDEGPPVSPPTSPADSPEPARFEGSG